MSEMHSEKSVTFVIPFVGFTLDTASGPRRYTNKVRTTSDPAEIAALRASASVVEKAPVAPAVKKVAEPEKTGDADAKTETPRPKRDRKKRADAEKAAEGEAAGGAADPAAQQAE